MQWGGIRKDINYNWVDKEINKINKKDIQLREQQMEEADNIFWKYIEKYPSSRKHLVFWNKEENCGNDTELGHELFYYIDCTLEQRGEG